MSGFWFNRLIEYWSLPEAGAVLDHVRRARVPVVQMGNFGPDFYSVAEDPGVARSWAGMPLVGVDANLKAAADLIPQVQEAGARVVGQLSMTMHFGDQESRLGLFGDLWERLWRPPLLGPAPAERVDDLLQRQADGGLRRSAIEGRPYFTYRGCICNPAWLSLLEAMVSKGIQLGLDGFNATHNYESFCRCAHCRAYLRQDLATSGEIDGPDLRTLFGADLEDVADPFEPRSEAPAPLLQRYQSAVARAAARRRKQAFDRVFITHGRALRPGLLLAQWYHKYGLRVDDERSGLTASEWAAGEDYIWYSQGPYRWGSCLEQGYLADMGLPARFMHAAGGGRPFVVNKYDYRRWRVWAGEAAAHGGAALAFHAGPPRLEQEEQSRIAPEDYFGPVIRYQRFLAEHESLLHPATPWSQVALVYPRRAERDGEPDCLDALKRVGEWLEDAHILFDIVLDEDLLERAGTYACLFLPDVRRLAAADFDLLADHVGGGGSLVFTGATGTLDERGRPRSTDPLANWRVPSGGVQSAGHGRVLYLADGPWQPERVRIRTLDAEMPVYRRLPDDDFGKGVTASLEQMCGGSWLRTDAPWFVRVRAWRPEAEDDLVVHWINYLQDEQAAIEVPIPVGPLAVDLALPSPAAVDRVEWRYPEMSAPATLEHQPRDGGVRFTIPRLIVYGMSVIRMAASRSASPSPSKR